MNLTWTDDPDQLDRFPQGRCGCGADLAGAADLGVVDRYQQHEIPPVSGEITQYDQHGAVRLRGGARRDPPRGRPRRPVATGRTCRPCGVPAGGAAFPRTGGGALGALTGAAPSVGSSTACSHARRGAVEVDKRIRALITLAYAVYCDETPLRVGPKKPAPGRKKAEKYLLVACTELYTYYLLGDRTWPPSRPSCSPNSTGVIVHDRYQTTTPPHWATLTHQLCCPHILRDLAGAGEAYPDAHWPTQIADALRGLIHHANLARAAGRDAIAHADKASCSPVPRRRARRAVDTTTTATGPANARPGCCWKSCATARPTCCASSTTCVPHLQPGRTRPAPRPRSSRTSPAG